MLTLWRRDHRYIRVQVGRPVRRHCKGADKEYLRLGLGRKYRRCKDVDDIKSISESALAILPKWKGRVNSKEKGGDFRQA